MDPKSIGRTDSLFLYENGIILTGKIKGYKNTDLRYPSYMITLFENEKESYARFPSGATYYFTNKNPFEILEKSEFYVKEEKPKTIQPFQVAFAYSKNEIKVDFLKDILADLRNSLSRNDLNLNDKKLINLYLENEKFF